jgi:hypothetical protein
MELMRQKLLPPYLQKFQIMTLRMCWWNRASLDWFSVYAELRQRHMIKSLYKIRIFLLVKTHITVFSIKPFRIVESYQIYTEKYTFPYLAKNMEAVFSCETLTPTYWAGLS